jgi:hypothetical protein
MNFTLMPGGVVNFQSFCSSRKASLLQRDSTRLFSKLLRMFPNAFASLSTQPADVPYAITVVSLKEYSKSSG